MAKNPYLKDANQVMEYTAEQVLEIQKCMNDPVHFAEKYCHIQHPVKGSVPVELYPYQKRMLYNFRDNRNTIVLSARQTGKCVLPSTTVEHIDVSNINTIKKIVLWLFDRSLYNELFSKNL